MIRNNDRISETGWRYYYNPHIVSVFQRYSEYKNSSHLWAITGDLDNLGVFVAKNGRANAENLVDLYNQVIRNYLDDWYEKNKKQVIALSFMPCGEEVLIVGVSKDKSITKNLFFEINKDIENIMNEQSFIGTEDTKASFGTSIIDNTQISRLINTLVLKYKKTKENQFIYPIYLKILKEIRTLLAIELDKVKFSNILNGEYPIEVRQIVLTQMLKYKVNTKNIISSLNEMEMTKLKLLMKTAGNRYGITFEQSQLINNILFDIDEKKN